MSQLTALQLLYTQYGDYPTPISAANPITRTSRRLARHARPPDFYWRNTLLLNSWIATIQCFMVSFTSSLNGANGIAASILVGQFIDLQIICSFEGKGGENKGVAYAALLLSLRTGMGRDRSVTKSLLSSPILFRLWGGKNMLDNLFMEDKNAHWNVLIFSNPIFCSRVHPGDASLFIGHHHYLE